MKTVGIIGGVGPESTIEYYRLIIAAYRERQSGTGVPPVDDHARNARAESAVPPVDDHARNARATSYPSIIINSVDLDRLLAWMKRNNLAAVTDYLVGELERLARAGASFAALAANTPHIVFDELQRRSPIPLLSIVEATRDEARAHGLKRVGLFGTRFTMQAQFYPEVFSRAGIQIIVPNDEEQSYIHEKYLGELLNDIFSSETREGLLAIVDRLREHGDIDGLILGGTELPLILRDAAHNGVPFLDTTRIHVDRIVTELLS
jgi:aspartate racemase